MIEFKCRECNELYSIEQKSQHCHAATINECPFACSNFLPCKVDGFDEHMKVCNSKELNCEDCGFYLYRFYSNSDVLEVTRGHLCGRDSLIARSQYEHEISSLKLANHSLDQKTKTLQHKLDQAN